MSVAGNLAERLVYVEKKNYFAVHYSTLELFGLKHYNTATGKS